MNTLSHLDKATQLQANTPLKEWLSYLEHAHIKAIDLGLTRIYSVAKDLELLNPAPFIITVAGTNGKGTSCRLLETILLNVGLKVGVYSSPHLVRYNERVRINNQELPDIEHSKSFAFINNNRKQSLSYFEFSTLSAFYLFKQAKVDVVILEVGLGGRLDATNIIDNNVAVITSIDIDHTHLLGTTREEIAFEKAGVFRENTPVVIGEPNIPQTMLEHAEKLHCVLSCRDKDWRFYVQGDKWSWESEQNKLLDLPIPKIPLANAATILATLEYLPFNISESIIYQSLAEVELAGRFQFLTEKERKYLSTLVKKPINELPQVVIDVGHNPHAARYLAEKLTMLSPPHLKGKIIAVCGILKDKDSQGIFEPLIPIINYWHCVTLDGERGQDSQSLFVTLQQIAENQNLPISGQADNDVIDGVEKALKQATNDDIVLVFGSFHTVSPLLEILSY